MAERRLAGFVVVCSAVCALAACPGKTNSPDAGSGGDASADAAGGPDSGIDAGVDSGPKIYMPVAATAYCAQRAQSFCARSIRCGFVDPGNLGDCLTAEAESCGIRFVGPAVTYGRAGFDPQLAGNCVGILGDDVCSSEYMPAACSAPILTPKVALGGSCFQNFECESGTYCDVASYTCAGTCTHYLETVGTPCTGIGQLCDPATLFCDYFNGGTCQLFGTPTGADGGPSSCQQPTDCADGSLCTFDTTGGHCTAGLGAQDLGGPCIWGQLPGCVPSAATLATVGDLYCRAPVQGNGTCEPQIAQGGACTQFSLYYYDPIYDQCVPGTVCNAAYDTGVCEPLSGLGQACDTAFACMWSRRPSSYVDYRNFEPHTQCDSTDFRCDALPGPGEPCNANVNYVCGNGWCDFLPFVPVCRALQPLGSECFDSSVCLSGFCGQPTVDGGLPTCRPPCFGDPDASYVEDAGFIEPDDAGSDGGGVDSGLDAGLPDAGADAGLDAGSDAGGLDAGGDAGDAAAPG
jgi:hypothetical protein